MRRGRIALALLLGGLAAGPGCSSGDGSGGSGGAGGAGGSGGGAACGAFHCLHGSGICEQFGGDSEQPNCEADSTAVWAPQACDNSGSFGGCRRSNGTSCSYTWYPDSLADTGLALRQACESTSGAWITLGSGSGGSGGSGGEGGAGGSGGTSGSGGEGGTGGTGGTGGVAKSGPITICSSHHCDQGIAGPTDVCNQFDDANQLAGSLCQGKVQGDGPCPDTTVGGCESQPDTPDCVVTVIYNPTSGAKALCENRPDERWLTPE